MKYLVSVTRTSYAETRILVEADSPEAARETALGQAGDVVFSEHSADYEVETVTACP